MRFISETDLEAEAEAILADFGRTDLEVTTPPVPVDEILEYSFGFTVDFADLDAHFCTGGILEATWVEQRCVFVDRSLDPTDHSEMAGRYNYTIAHTIGHLQLHHAELLDDSKQASLFASPPEVRCVTPCIERRTKERKEWQADYFAACLLMPRGD